MRVLLSREENLATPCCEAQPYRGWGGTGKGAVGGMLSSGMDAGRPLVPQKSTETKKMQKTPPKHPKCLLAEPRAVGTGASGKRHQS